MKSRTLIIGFLLFGLTIAILGTRGIKAMGELGQAPEPAQNASFLHVGSSLKVLQSGTMTVSKGASSASASAVITHNLGFAPAFVAYYTNPDGSVNIQLPYKDTSYAADGTLISGLSIHAVSNTTTFTVFVAAPFLTAGSPYYSNANTYLIKYYLLENPAH